MRFAYHPTMCNPAFYLELAKTAEAAGFSTITFPDSICYPKECDSTYPYNDDGIVMSNGRGFGQGLGFCYGVGEESEESCGYNDGDGFGSGNGLGNGNGNCYGDGDGDGVVIN